MQYSNCRQMHKQKERARCLVCYTTTRRTVWEWERHGRSRRRLDHFSELGAVPAPGAVGDNVGRLGFEWSVVSVELARLVSWTVVVRVTDRWHAAVGHAPHSTIHLESARDFIDHLASLTEIPIPLWTAPTPAKQNENGEWRRMIHVVRSWAARWHWHRCVLTPNWYCCLPHLTFCLSLI